MYWLWMALHDTKVDLFVKNYFLENIAKRNVTELSNNKKHHYLL